MTFFSPQLKHHILTQYQPHGRENSFAALAQHYNIAGGGETVRIWYQRWDGSAVSLERRKVSGRPRLLSNIQVNNLIRTPIKNKNRAHAAVNYPQLLPSVREKTGKKIALRTLQNYGKRDVGIKAKQTNKRTAAESESTHTTHHVNTCMYFDRTLTSSCVCVFCLPLSVM